MTRRNATTMGAATVDQTPPRLYLATYTLPDRVHPTWSVSANGVEQIPHGDRAAAERAYETLRSQDVVFVGGKREPRNPALSESRVWDGDAGCFVRYARVGIGGARRTCPECRMPAAPPSFTCPGCGEVVKS